jgi:hypothetical protein
LVNSFLSQCDASQRLPQTQSAGQAEFGSERASGAVCLGGLDSHLVENEQEFFHYL